MSVPTAILTTVELTLSREITHGQAQRAETHLECAYRVAQASTVLNGNWLARIIGQCVMWEVYVTWVFQWRCFLQTGKPFPAPSPSTVKYADVCNCNAY
eukprot:5727890-Amphidinium_carterae.1